MGFGQTWSAQNYDRKIKYLDYMENGVRCRGVGYVKLEQRDSRCSIELQINGLYRRDHFTRPLLLLDSEGERELCRVKLADGGARVHMERLDSRDMDGKKLCYEQVIGLRVPVSEGREIRCMWASPKEIAAHEEPVQLEEAIPSEMPIQETVVATGTSSAGENVAATETRPAGETPQPQGNEAAGSIVYEDKWTQLWVIYPHIRPFQDEREYLSVGPGDFVILPARYYKLVNNSFLLHGYYNYRHLIMARIEQRSSVKYYIGVPGNYYVKEKKIAVMFGFESFECEGEPAQEGDFGYYMIPVEL